MLHAPVTPAGDLLRWVEIPGAEPARVYLHGLGASSLPYFTATAVHPALAGRRSLLMDLLGHGISDRPADFSYSLEAHADAVAAALAVAGVDGVELVAHSMGGAVGIVLAARYPGLVSQLVLVDANLDPIDPAPGAPGSGGIADFTEAQFLAGGWRETRDVVGPHWWATMRLTDRLGLHRSAVRLAQGTRPTMRALLLELDIPRSFLHPEAYGEPADSDGLRRAGVRVVAVPDCGHNLMLDNPDGFADAVAEALA